MGFPCCFVPPRSLQSEYVVNKQLAEQLGNKRVGCLAEGCSFKAPLRIFLMHSHGKTGFSNAEVDFDKLLVDRSQLCLSPTLVLPDGDAGGRPATIREQLLQVEWNDCLGSYGGANW